MADNHIAFCRQHLRDHDRDMYLTGLLYPQQYAAALTAIDAFNAEIARVRSLVSEPMPGEIRLQWWRDALSGSENGALSNPIAAALLRACETHDLDRTLLDKALLARAFDLYEDPMPDRNTLEGYAGETLSSLFLSKAKVVGLNHDSALADAAGYTGVALTMAERLRSFAVDRSRGQVYLPLDFLRAHGLDRNSLMGPVEGEKVRSALVAFADEVLAFHKKAIEAVDILPKKARAIFRPLALVPAYMSCLQKPAFKPLEEVPSVSPLRAQWALWRF